MRARNAAVLVVGALALLGAGCYGDTDEASNVGGHAATLNFHGKANNGPAYSVVQYWKSADPSTRLTTPLRNWPAGAQGSFGEQAQHLSEETDYSFRLCGNDQGKWPPICASTKQFTTGRAVSTATSGDPNDPNYVTHFTSDPGVNNNLVAQFHFNFFGPSWVDFTETFCPAMTCGSHINPLSACFDLSQTGFSGVECRGEGIDIKVGDLDDVVHAEDFAINPATIDGGPGDDLIAGGTSYGGGLDSDLTVIGGSGQDDIRTLGGDDTINARSASLLNPDTDKSISCGDGVDTVIADRSDPISAGQNGCETVLKP